MLLYLVAVPLARAQEADPRPRRLDVRIVRADDGLPMPGVPVMLMPVRMVRTPRARDGWLVAGLGDRYVQPRVQGHSDPDGNVCLQVADARHVAPYRILAGAPFEGRCQHLGGDSYLLRVTRKPQVRVEVSDHRGQPLAGFEVGLYAAQRTVQHRARTDAFGVATFALREGFKARLQARPLSWIGPTDSMPTTAVELPRQTLKLVVPPFGTLRVRPVDGDGKPTSFHGIHAHTPANVGATAYGDEDVRGVEFERVAVGAKVRGYLHSKAGTGHWQAVGGPAGTVTVRDIAVTRRADGTPSDLSAQPLPLAFRPRKPVARAKAVVSLRLVSLPVPAARRLRVEAVQEGGATQRIGCSVEPAAEGGSVLTVQPRPGDREVVLSYAGAELRRFAVADLVGGKPASRKIEGLGEALGLRRVTVVDGEGVPVLRAFFRLAKGRGATGSFTDASGVANVAMPAGTGPLLLSAAGFRERRFDRLQQGQRIVLQKDPGLLVVVPGIPAAWPRDRLGIWLRPFDGKAPGTWQDAPLADGDRVQLRAPTPGKWLVRLSVRTPGKSGGSLHLLHEGAVEVTAKGPLRLELPLPETTRREVADKLGLPKKGGTSEQGK